jgi:MSHA pilin protein MshA
MLKMKLKNQKGFTLIEIIAVLVILGILAAVAVPKFMGLQDDAKNSAGKGALAAAAGNVQTAYAKLLVAGTAGTTNSTLLTELGSSTVAYTNLGDFIVSYANGTGTSADKGILITLQTPTTGFGTPSSKYVPVIQ